MGFEDAAVAIIDEDQQDALKELFDKLSDLYVKLVDKFVEYYNVDGFLIHDDWGTQRAPFFSVDVGREMLVPYMKKVTDLKGRPLLLFVNPWSIGMTLDRNPGLELSEFARN